MSQTTQQITCFPVKRAFKNAVIKTFGVSQRVRPLNVRSTSRYWSELVLLLLPIPAGATAWQCMSWLSWFNHGCQPANRPLDPDTTEWKQTANFAVRACSAGWTSYTQIAALCTSSHCSTSAVSVSILSRAHLDKLPSHQTVESLVKVEQLKTTERHSELWTSHHA